MRRSHRKVLACLAVAAAACSVHAQGGEQLGPAPAPPRLAGAEGAPGEQPLTAGAAPIEATPLGGSDEQVAPLRTKILGAGDAHAEEIERPLRAGEGWWRTAGALAIVVALIVCCGAGVRAWARRTGGIAHAFGAGGRAPSGILQVLGRYPVGRGQTLVLLKLDRRVLLVSQSAGARAGGMQTLCELTDPEEVAAVLMLTAEAEGRTLGARFREMVSAFDSTHAEADRVLAPVVVERSAPRPGEHDPVGSLRSRLASLREVERGRSA